jgi:hypothetical protein
LPSALGSKLMTLTTLPDMIERGIADKLDDDSQIEAGDFGAQGHRLRVPASSERPSQRAGSMQGNVVVSCFDSARTTEPSEILTRDVEAVAVPIQRLRSRPGENRGSQALSNVASLKIDDRVEDGRPIGAYRNFVFVSPPATWRWSAQRDDGQTGTRKEGWQFRFGSASGRVSFGE